MKLGLTTDSLAGLSCDEMLATCERLGLQAIELGCGAWSSAPHIDVDALLASDAKCKEYLDKVASHGLTIAALNCSGNQLDPGVRGPRHDAQIRKTFQLAEKLGIQRVVMMSGLPGGQPGGRTPSWILTHYPPECHEILKYQWEVCVNWWRDFVPFARDCGVRKIALEPHGWQLVYNVQNLRTLRAALGGCDDLIGFNMDPSHPFWMGADPIQMIRELKDAIFYVHLKDVHTNADQAALNTMFDSKPGEQMFGRSWNFVIPGSGHDELWWTTFTRELKLAGYDDTLSFEMEDHSGEPVEVLSKGVAFMKRIV